jgi:hypothetical protein
MNLLNGIPIIVMRPTIKTVSRSWRERLFTWPWRPWVKTKEEVSQPPIGPDQCFKMGDRFICGESFYAKLQNEVSK